MVSGLGLELGISKVGVSSGVGLVGCLVQSEVRIRIRVRVASG